MNLSSSRTSLNLRTGVFPVLRPQFGSNGGSHARQVRVAWSIDGKDDMVRPISLVADIQTPSEVLITVSPESTLHDALSLIVKHQVRGLPVTDKSGLLVGMVSDFDLINLEDISGKSPDAKDVFPAADKSWVVFREIKERLDRSKAIIIKDVMDQQLTVVHPDQSIDVAARLLLDHKRRRLPVVDRTGMLVGIVSRGDILKAALILRKRQIAKGAGPNV